MPRCTTSNSVGIPRHSSAGRAAFSLLEVMISIAVLAVALGFIVGHYQFLDQNRQFTEQMSKAQEIARQIMDRVASLEPAKLGVLADAPWSIPRFEDADVTDDAAAMTEADLIAMNLRAAPSGLESLRVYVEYYRGLTDAALPGPNNLGVMDDAAITSAAAFHTSFADPTWRTPRRLLRTIKPATQVAAEKPFAVRILVTWGPQSAQRVELLTARRSSGE
jgi:prepilin-type N-terminal cleavage/methylation domain-containing protein